MSLISILKSYFARVLASFTTSNNPINISVVPTHEFPTCRFRLDNGTSDTLTLPDGRKLGYAQYGSPSGRAVLYLHGLPGSRIEAAAFDELGLKLGARIVATDRPGYGWSSPQPGRTLLGFPKDLEYLADCLKLDEYCVLVWLGISGGGPYALACAMSLPPEKLKCVSIVCGLGPPDIGMKGAGWLHWFAFTVGWRYSIPIFIKWFWQLGVEGRLDLTDEQRLEMLLLSAAKSASTANKKDVAVMKDEDVLRLFLRSTREALSQGFDGLTQDGKLVSTDFGFRIEDIRPDLPVQLWYGKHDTFVPLNHGEQIAARLGGRAHLRVEDETHGSISRNLKEEILTDLIKSL